MNRDLLAFAAGALVFVILYSAYWVALGVLDPSSRVVGAVLLVCGYAVPFVSGGLTSYLAGAGQFWAVLFLGVVGSLLVAVINFAASRLGAPTDFAGVSSIPLVAGLSLVVQLPLVLIGGAVGGLWLRRHA